MKYYPIFRSLSLRTRLLAVGASLALALPLAAQEQDSASYEGGRGLITTEGPSGMFINPTSGTMPAKAATAQYCVYFPNNKTDVVGHGLMLAYGVTDEFELGAMANLVDIDDPSKQRAAGGPLARYRLTKDEGAMPQLSVGAYSRFGDTALNKVGAFGAAYKRLPVSDDGFLRAVGLHAGLKELWFDDDAPVSDSFSGYAGLEVQLPLRIYAVGEVTSKDDDVNQHVPYAFGLQWRAPGIAMSLAGIQNGNVDDVSFYYGIGVTF